MSNQQEMSAQITAVYDQMFRSDIHEEMFNGSGFSNWGFWSADTQTAVQASEQLVDRLVAPIPHRGAVLDVACGSGGTTARLARLFDEVTAINASAYQVERTQARVPGCRALQMDGSALAFPDASFDAVICVEAAFHFPSRARFIAEANRVLKPGGWLALSDLLIAAPQESFAMRRLAELPPTMMPYANLWNLPTYRDLFEVLGFKVTIESSYHETRQRFSAFYKNYCEQKIVAEPARADEYRRLLAVDSMFDIGDYILVTAQKVK